MRLGHNGSIVALVAAGLVALAVIAVLAALAVRAMRRRFRVARAQRDKRERDLTDRQVPWTVFSRPDLSDGGRTWQVGVERRSDDDRVLSGPVYVTDAPIPRDDDRARIEAEGTAIRWAAEYTEARAR